MIRKLIFGSTLKSFSMVLLFALVYIFSNNEHVREGIGDQGFDLLDKFVVSEVSETLADTPSLLVFSYDNKYMSEKNLWDEDKNSNYGNLFERSRLTHFIEVLDKRSQRLKAFGKATPKALFIDFDLSFTLMPDGKTLSAEDKAFLERLKVARDYVIVLPKAQSANFVEKAEDQEIQRLIKAKKIVFASVGFNLSKDNTVRRYRAFEHFHENGVEKSYVNANLYLWKLSQNKALNVRAIEDEFSNKDVVLNRIVFKGYENELGIQSRWKHYKHYSVLRHASKKTDRVGLARYENAIVMLGTSYDKNADTFQVLNIFGSEQLSGIEIHANILMSLFFFNGQLKLLPFGWTLFLVFLVFFLLDSLMAVSLAVWNIEANNWTNAVVFVLSSLVLALMSWMFLYMGYWLDWFAPVVLLDWIT